MSVDTDSVAWEPFIIPIGTMVQVRLSGECQHLRRLYPSGIECVGHFPVENGAVGQVIEITPDLLAVPGYTIFPSHHYRVKFLVSLPITLTQSMDSGLYAGSELAPLKPHEEVIAKIKAVMRESG